MDDNNSVQGCGATIGGCGACGCGCPGVVLLLMGAIGLMDEAPSRYASPAPLVFLGAFLVLVAVAVVWATASNSK